MSHSMPDDLRLEGGQATLPLTDLPHTRSRRQQAATCRRDQPNTVVVKEGNGVHPPDESLEVALVGLWVKIRDARKGRDERPDTMEGLAMQEVGSRSTVLAWPLQVWVGYRV